MFDGFDESARPTRGRACDAAERARVAEAIELAVAESRSFRRGRAARSNGWTPERVRTLLETLVDRGSTTDAARAAGMSRRGLYALCRRTEARALRAAWSLASGFGRQRRSAARDARATTRSFRVVRRGGTILLEPHQHDLGGEAQN